MGGKSSREYLGFITSKRKVNTLLLVNIMFWVVAFLALIFSIVILVKRIWLPYFKILVIFVAFYMFLNFLALFSMQTGLKISGLVLHF